MLFFMSNLFSETVINVSTAPQLIAAIYSLNNLDATSVKIIINSSINDLTTSCSINFENFDHVKNLTITATSNGITLQNDSNNNMFNVSGSYYNENKPSFKLSNLTLYSNNVTPSTNVAAVYLSDNFNNLEFLDCTFNNYNNSIKFPEGPNTFSCVERFKILRNTCNGINSSNISDSFFIGNGSYKILSFQGNHIYRCMNAIRSPLSNTDEYTIDNNVIDTKYLTELNPDGKLDFHKSSTAFSLSLIITNNIFRHTRILVTNVQLIMDHNDIFCDVVDYSFLNIETKAGNLHTSTITNNTFWGSNFSEFIKIVMRENNNRIKINNNSFLTGGLLLNFHFPQYEFIINPISEFKNNLINNVSTSCYVTHYHSGQAVHQTDFDPNDKIIADHCFFTSNISNNSFSIPNIGTDNFVGNPLITLNPTDHTYILNWTNTQKSPLIDSGSPDTDGDGILWFTDVDDQDLDGTRKDIGAVTAQNHKAMAHSLKRETNNIYNWICFPYMDRLYSNGTQNTVDYLFNDYHQNDLFVSNPNNRIINQVIWKYNSDDAYAYYDSYNQKQNFTMNIKSQYGLKVELVPSQLNQPAKILDTAGFECGAQGNNDNVIHIDRMENNIPREIWVGYFPTSNEYPLVALGSVANNLIEIKTKKWCMSRNSVFQAWTVPSVKAIFNSGEAVSLKYVGTSATDYTWQSSRSEVPDYEEATPQYFTYNEEMDYIPVYVLLSDLDIDTKSNQDLWDEEIEFRYWEPSLKGKSQKINRYAVYDETTEEFQNRPFSFSENKQFYTISLNAKDILNSSFPKISTLQGNYPNPFNPETQIKYTIAESGNVKIEIFNVKGQVVKTLINENKNAGYYTTTWKGDDQTGNKVASGVYFYRLSTPQSSTTRKMLLMK